MKIYFEDGVLTATQQLKLGSDYFINAANGYSANERALDRIKETVPDAIVYTNSLVPLLYSDIYCWDNEAKIFELYIRQGDDFVRVDKLTNRELRFGHNLFRLWRAGEFDRGG